MNERELEEELRALLNKTSQEEVATLGLDDDLVERLGLDSLAGLRLLAAVEKHFAVRFPDQRLGEFRTMRLIMEVITSRPEEKPS
jgi:acyl carrier protein